MSKNLYYDGTKLLSLKDKNGNTPEIYIVTGNRSAGKTTFFNRLLVKKFLQKGEQFALIVRYAYELDGIADKFFSDIRGLFFSDYYVKAKKKSKGVYSEIYIRKNGEKEEKICGYAVPLNNADNIKKCSHIFNSVERCLFDEFQPETGCYCDKEIDKFISLHKSIARGRGKFSRRVPVYMLSNAVTLINPYFLAFGIAEKIQENTKFLRGVGVVFEQNYNANSAKAQAESAFDAAFSGEKMIAYSQQNIYLNDSKTFIDKPTGKNRYLATLIYNGKSFSIREFSEVGVIYCGVDIDINCKTKIALTAADHSINYVMLRNNSFFINILKWYFERGAFRFKDLECKNVILTALKY